jgi:hypothetical protein
MTASTATQPFGLAALLAMATLVGGCNAPPDDSASEPVAQQLVGTWLREYQEQGAVVRRVLVLQPGGNFIEESVARVGDAPPVRHEHEGEWLYDGTNLKRHYLQIDGRSPAAPTVPFATFEIRLPTRNEFVGIDNVHRIEVRYRRVAEGTEP